MYLHFVIQIVELRKAPLDIVIAKYLGRSVVITRRVTVKPTFFDFLLLHGVSFHFFQNDVFLQMRSGN